MDTYISKPKTVRAIQWRGKEFSKIKEFFESCGQPGFVHSLGTGCLRLETELIDVEICILDWIICNENGVVFMANDATFRDRYDPVQVDDASEILDPDGGTNERPLGD